MKSKINRRKSLNQLTSSLAGISCFTGCGTLFENKKHSKELAADLVVIGGGLGGCAAALSALQSGLTVILTEETDWIGGQLTSQGVPPDEHKWIESFGCTKSYRRLREAIRKFYKDNYPLTSKAKQATHFNPGNGTVSRICHEPKVALKCIESLFDPYLIEGKLKLLKRVIPISAEVVLDNIKAIEVLDIENNNSIVLTGEIYVDATELGDLLPITGCEYVMGTEGKNQTGELHMPKKASPSNQQAFTVCFAIDHRENEEHLIEKPVTFDYWKEYIPNIIPAWPGKLIDFTYTHPSTGKAKRLGFNPTGPHKSGIINLWTYRRILSKENFLPSSKLSDVSLINWPQNDYLEGNLTGVSLEEKQSHINKAKQLSLSLLYWLQTEAPRDDGGNGWPGLRLRKDIMGTRDGMAKYPYVRESRRIKALTTIIEQDCGVENRKLILGNNNQSSKAKNYHDSVGIGHYQIDLHPTSEGDNYIDFAALPFELPLGSLIPRRLNNLIAANKNIGTTHITNGCYRLHPVEWNIGEVAGFLAAEAIGRSETPKAIRQTRKSLISFQNKIQKAGVEIHWSQLKS